MKRRSKSKSEPPENPEFRYISSGTAKLPAMAELQRWQPEGRGVFCDDNIASLPSDKKPYLTKSIHFRLHLFRAKTLPGALEVLHKELPDWLDNLRKCSDKTEEEEKAEWLVAESVRIHLVALSAKFDKLLPPVPESIEDIMRWALFVETYIESGQGKKNVWDELPLYAKVTALMRSDPHIHNDELAAKLGIHKQRLYEIPHFSLKTVRRVFRDSERESHLNAKSSGSKDGKTGDIDAWRKQDCPAQARHPKK